tara:strand:- start:432 stop:827 length:396 start_codon:yes stop_codon:yes gene_type:complete
MIKLKDILMENVAVDTAGIILRDPTLGVVLCKDTEKWGIPKGKVELGEEPIDAACRETMEETSIFIVPNGSHIAGPLRLVKTKKNSRGADFYIYECDMKMAVVPVKSLEHEEVRWFSEMPEDIDPRLKGLI